MYGQSGEASRCNAEQEAGLAFARVDQPLDTVREIRDQIHDRVKALVDSLTKETTPS